MTHPQDVLAPSPTVSEAMREAVAMILLHQLDVACHLAPGRCKGELEGLPEAVDALCAPAGPIASALAALERDSATLRAERDEARAAAMSWKGVAERLAAYIGRADTELATLRASAERRETALVMARQAVANSVEMHRPWAEKIAGRVNPWQPILDAVDAALTPKETPDA